MTNTNTEKQRLKSKLKKVEATTGIPYNHLFKRYFLDQFIALIAQSKYCNDFVFKGGMILSNMFGIASRQTEDVDAMFLKNTDTVEDVVKEIVQTPTETGVQFSVVSSRKIIEGRPTENGEVGRRIILEFRYINMHGRICFDVGPKVPSATEPRKYVYSDISKSENHTIYVDAIEKVVSEKLSAIGSREERISRFKDFFDVYCIFSRNDIAKANIETVYKACEQTYLNNFPGEQGIFNIPKLRSTLSRIQANEENVGGVRNYCSTTDIDATPEEIFDKIFWLLDELEACKK